MLKNVENYFYIRISVNKDTIKSADSNNQKLYMLVTFYDDMYSFHSNYHPILCVAEDLQ